MVFTSCGADDSGNTAPTCGDGICSSSEETQESCRQDCPCMDLTCAVSWCERACDLLPSCYPDDYPDYVSCVDWMCDTSYWMEDAMDNSVCEPTIGKLFQCLGQLTTCEEWMALDEPTSSSYPCADEIGAQEASCSYPPYSVNVRVLGVMVYPTKNDGCMWDGTCNALSNDELAELYEDVTGLVGLSISTQAAVSIAAKITGTVISHFSKPDVRGVISFYSEGEEYSLDVRETEDELAPQWGLNFGYNDIPFDGLTLGLELWDADDFNSNDAIGTAFFTYEDLIQVWQAGPNGMWLNATSPQNHQLIGVRVRIVE